MSANGPPPENRETSCMLPKEWCVSATQCARRSAGRAIKTDRSLDLATIWRTFFNLRSEDRAANALVHCPQIRQDAPNLMAHRGCAAAHPFLHTSGHRFTRGGLDKRPRRTFAVLLRR